MSGRGKQGGKVRALGLQFPVGRVYRLLQKGRYAERIFRLKISTLAYFTVSKITVLTSCDDLGFKLVKTSPQIIS
ncbi:unnamed protein product [Caretta caretta]